MASKEDTGATLRSHFSAEGGVKSAFSPKVADYVASRPDYPVALFDTLTRLCPPGPAVTAADVAAGTGLFTQGLLQRGYRVVAVEPNPEMRAAADRRLGGMENYRSVAGSGEAMPLANGSIQLITVAQAFHWFDAARAREEFLRVLTAQGQVALIWNDRVPGDALHDTLDAVFDEFGGAKRSALVAHESSRTGVAQFFGPNRPQEYSWPHAHHLDEGGLLSLVFSRSYMPDKNTPGGRQVTARVRAIFERFSTQGRIDVRYRTIAILGRLD